MQTFLPLARLDSIKYLDTKRLGNQVWREGYTLIQGKWANHPARKMWAGHEFALAEYCLYGLEELARRGRYYNKWVDYFLSCMDHFPDTGLPWWFGEEKLHSSHRAALLLKDPEWYGQFGWTEEPGMEYWWPN